MAKRILIETKGLKKIFTIGDEKAIILKSLDIQIYEGEFVAIMGPSGSGKSTFMHILGFLDVLSEGKYRFEGQDVSHLTDAERAGLRASNIGFVFQSFNLLANDTVLNNVMLPMLYAEIPAHEREDRAKKALDRVGLSHRLEFQANRISGGERQRVAIARALVNEPAIIFADEPTGNLDTASGTVVLGLLADLHKEGKTIVMVTHEEEAAQYAERIIRLRDGLLESDKRVKKPRRNGYRK
jgi:putative ABC transport system ATP-binding protein